MSHCLDGEVSDFTLDGSFYDSFRLEMGSRSARGLLLHVAEATVCAQSRDDIVVRRTRWTKDSQIRNVVLRVDGARLELGSCAVASDGDMLVGATAVFADGLAADGEGSGYLVGQTTSPLRRWSAKIP